MENSKEGLAALCLISALIAKLQTNGVLIPRDKETLISYAQSLARSFPTPYGPAASQYLGEFGPLHE